MNFQMNVKWNECFHFNRICHLSKFYSFQIFHGVTILLVDFQIIIIQFMENGKAFCRKYTITINNGMQLWYHCVVCVCGCACIGFHFFSILFLLFHFWVHIRIVQSSKFEVRTIGEIEMNFDIFHEPFLQIEFRFGISK